tara:strand:+ start:673 stop:1407 length:735 start_codon:yes stop_codon:yes gene_type:complete
MIATIILAAGKGKRMESDIPKVLHKLNGKSLIDRVIETSYELSSSKIIAVIGHQKERVKKSLMKHPNIEFAIQNEQKGTAHAVKMCFDNLKSFSGDVLILSGDVPLISLDTLKKLIRAKRETNAKASVLTADADNPYGYGRIFRNSKGLLKKMREHKDCNEQELLVNEINAGIYIIEKQFLFKYIPKIGNQNSQSEYYLPDLINLMISDNHLVSIYKTDDITEISGINSKKQLNQLETYLNEKK